MRYSIVFLTLAASITVNAAPLAIRDGALPSYDQASVAATPTTTEEVPSVAVNAATEAPTILESETETVSLTTESSTEGNDPRTLDPNFWSVHYAGYPIDENRHTLTVPTTFDPWDGTFTDFHKPFYITRSPDGFVGRTGFGIGTKKDEGSEEEDEYTETILTELAPRYDQENPAATPTTTTTSSATETPTEENDPRTTDPYFWSTYYAGYPIDSDGHTLTVPTTFDPWDRTWSDFGKEFYITHAPDGFEGDLIFAIEVKKDKGSEEEGKYVEAIPTDLA